MPPVTLYQSTDTDAPQLANAAGSLKTLLGNRLRQQTALGLGDAV